MGPTAQLLILLLFLFVCLLPAILGIYLGICGNKLTALKYIKLGYKVAETDPVRIEMAKRAWGLPDNAFITKEK